MFLIMQTVLFGHQDQDYKWNRSGDIFSPVGHFWKMAATGVKDQICDGPIAKKNILGQVLHIKFQAIIIN